MTTQRSTLELEAADTKLKSFWEIAQELGVADAVVALRDQTIPWINRNSVTALKKPLRDAKMVLASKLLFYFDHVIKQRYRCEPASTTAMFEQALAQPVTLWRGGGGTYDPAWRPQGRSWLSFTADKGRMETFSHYRGTHARRGYHVLPTNTVWWQVELSIKLDDLCLYLDAGMDHEVLIPCRLAKRAVLIDRSPEEGTSSS